MKRIALLLATAVLGGAAPPERVDLIIRGGTIYTGSDAPFVGDVAISGDRIRGVGRHLSYRAARVIDAHGMIVAPGFIDAHTHVGGQLADANARTRLIPAFLMQGVTTALIGNDGGGDPDVANVLGSARRRPVGINYAAYVGFGAVRQAVIGDADRADAADGRGVDVPGRARPFDRPVLRAAKLRHDRGGRRFGPGSGRAGRPL
jgi:N-acyl-D-aspartate/D-glutamate deacylase